MLTCSGVSPSVLRWRVCLVSWLSVHHHQVNKMSHFTDLSKVEQVSSMVRRMEKEIEECSDQAMLFNSREQ